MLDEFKLEQHIVYKTLLNSIKNNKCSHAYLIDANNYSKALDLAIAFAKYILCPNCYTNSENCKNCNQCRNIDNREFIELKIIEAEGQWIKKNQLEELQLEFSKKSFILGNKKIYIINGLEKLNVASSNSLLKFLEEPEEGIVAILITNNINQLLDTIRSRCQILKLNPTKNDMGNTLTFLGNNLYNNKIDIENYINNEENLIKVEKIINFIKYYEENHLNTLIYVNKLWNQYFKERQEIINAFGILLLFYKDVFNYQLKTEVVIFKEYVKEIEYVSKKNKINVIMSKINVIMNLKEKIKFNINNNLLLDKLLIELEGCE